MKRKIINSITILACMVSISYAQTNLDFETWGPSTYGSSDPTGWTTFNLDLLGFPISTFQETANPGLGLSSVRMVTTAGYMGFFGVDIIGGVASQTVPYTDKPISVEFMFKSNILSGDTGLFVVTLQHWDGTQTVIDGEAEMKFSGPPVTNWTTLSLPIIYSSCNPTPDTIMITMASSIAVPAPAVGSVLEIDAIVLNVPPPCPPPTASFTYSNSGLGASFTGSSGGGTAYTVGVTAASSMDYSFSGDFSGLDPNMNVSVGDTIVFNVSSPGHPFWLKTIQGTGTGNAVSVTNNGTSSGTIVWVPTSAGSFFYNCQFHSGMTGTINVSPTATTYAWDFGDGSGTSSSQSPDYIYPASGTYNVCLIVTDTCCIDSICQSVTVLDTNICPPPTANFNSFTSGLAITCTDASSVSGNVTYFWDFGDGSGTSTLQNTGYIYAASGTYNVCLTLVDSCGTDSICQSVTVVDTLCPGPTAGFASFTSGLAITCTDASSVSGTATYSWDFGDGLGTSTQQNAGYIYTTSGPYDVCLAVTDTCGTDTVCQTITVVDTLCPPPTAGFTYSANGLSVLFANSISVESYTIGVNASNSMDYTFSGDVSGLDPSFDVNIGDTVVFNVSASGHPFWLKTIQGTGQGNSVAVSNNGTTSGTIVWVPTTAGIFFYNCEFHSGMTGTINVIGSTTSFVWDFGDGTGSSIEQSPSYAFAASGTYSVCLTVTDSCGTDSVCQNVIVTGSGVGIPNVINEQFITVYPNPTQSVVYFKNTLNDPVMIYIYNAMGSLLQFIEIDDYEKSLNVESYSEGIYFYRVLGRNASNNFQGCFTVFK